MSDLGLTPGEVVDALSESRNAGYIIVAALALIVYNALLSFPQEIKCIWNRKFGTVAILYLLIKYGTICNMVLQAFSGFNIPTTIASCEVPGILASVIDVLCRFSYAAFDCLRIWGITQHQWVPTILMFTLSMFDPVVNIYGYSDPLIYQVVQSGPLAGCWASPKYHQYMYWGVITRSFSVAADAAALYFTLSATWCIVKTGSEVRTSTTLASTLLRNGFIQFGALLLLNIIAVILDVLTVAGNRESNFSSFIYLQEIFNSILLSHFILNLRSIYLPDGNHTQTGQKTTSIHFAANIQGNLGAILDTSWVTGEEGGDEEVKYSDNPLAVGLFNTDGLRMIKDTCGIA